jgi:hypothetical protein
MTPPSEERYCGPRAKFLTELGHRAISTARGEPRPEFSNNLTCLAADDTAVVRQSQLCRDAGCTAGPRQ